MVTESEVTKTASRPLRTVSDILADAGELPRMTLDSVLDRDIVIWGVEERVGDYGTYLVLQCSDVIEDDRPRWAVVTGATVIVRKLLAVRDAGGYPCMACIVRKDNYYDVV